MSQSVTLSLPNVFDVVIIAFSQLPVLVLHQEGNLACKNTAETISKGCFGQSKSAVVHFCSLHINIKSVVNCRSMAVI